MNDLTKPSDTTEGPATVTYSSVGAYPESLQIIDNLRVGGAQRLLLALAEPGEPDLPFRILALKQCDAAIADQLGERDVKVGYAGIGRRLSLISWWRVARMLWQSPEPVVHVHLTSSIIIASPLAKLMGKKVIVSLHNVRRDPGNRLGNRLLNRTEILSLRHFADAIVAVGEQVKTSNEALFPKTPIHVLRNVIPTAARHSDAERLKLKAGLGAGPDDLVFLSTGRLSPQKDHPTMFKAFARVLETLPDSWLWVAGTGASREGLQQIAADLGIAWRVKFLGERSDVDLLISASDLFLLSSAWEGLPLALLEAMSQGLPAVATRVGDVPVVLPPDAGMVVPPHAPQEFAQAIVALGSDAELRMAMSERARVAARSYTDIGQWKAALGHIYRNALAED